MVDDSVSLLGGILQAARERRREAARAYILAIQSSLLVGESAEELAHEHRQLYLSGLDVADQRR